MLDVLLLKFILVFVMAFFYGIERQLTNKPVGFGTFIFVALGSCALGEISLILSPDNILIITGGIVTGIGFLGAGSLIKTTDKIFGFTTASSIWIFSIIGLVIGLEQYMIAVIMYVLVWIVLVVDWVLENKGIGSYQRRVTLKTKEIVDKSEFLKLFKGRWWKLISITVDNKEKKESVVYLVSGPRSYVSFLNRELIEKDWIESFSIE